MKKLTKKEKSIISMYFIEPKKKKERKKKKKLYVYEKREEKQKKKSVFPFSLFLRYGKKIPSALGESCGNRKFLSTL